jgi:hypothetical protein
MPMLGSRGGGSVRGFGRFGRILRLTLVDTFNRVNAALNISSDGLSQWSTQRGVFNILGTAAYSNFPDSVATVELDSSNIVNAQIDMVDDQGGVGLAFWVTDANSWWGVYPHYTSTTTTSTSSSCTGPGNPNRQSGGVFHFPPGDACNVRWLSLSIYMNCGSTPYGAIAIWGGKSYCGYGGGGVTAEEYQAAANGCAGQGLGGTGIMGCDGQYFIDNTIATVTNTTTNYTSAVAIKNQDGVQHNNVFASSLNPVRSIAISTSGNTISYSAYSAANKSGSVIASSSITPSSPTKGNLVGVFRTTSAHAQGGSVRNINVTVV